MEMRHVAVTERLRAADEGEGRLTGLVSTYEERYNIGGGVKEEIATGAFDTYLAERSVLPIYHQHGHKLGNPPVGVAEFTSGEDGLRADVELFVDDDATAKALYRVAKRTGGFEWSIGFVPDPDGIEVRERGSVERITKARLYEASIVLIGANRSTATLEVRGAAEDPAPEPALVVPDADTVAELMGHLDAEGRSLLRDLLDVD